MRRHRRHTIGLTASAASSSHDLYRTEVYTVLTQRFMADALEAPFAASSTGWTDIDESTLLEAVELLAATYECSRSATEWRRAWLLARDASHVLVTLSAEGRWEVSVAAESQASAESILSRFAAAFPEPDFSDGGDLAVRFWSMGPMGPFSYQRRITINPWADTAANYPDAQRSQLDRLMAMDAPRSAGKLIIWHGAPGTGKTSALRSLADAWRDWCDVDYIVDADEFFGHAAYMVSALVDGSDSDRWRLVVLEDAGEFLQPLASKDVGQGLSRLFNLTDGLVGQGLKLMVLATTNEPADSFHPAVIRPGRCMAEIEFNEFTADEADRWLVDHDRAPAGRPMSLAELYAS